MKERDDVPGYWRPKGVERDGDVVYEAPPDDMFEEAELDYVAGFDLEEIGDDLIREVSAFGFLRQYQVAYCWKRNGSTKALRRVFGTCEKTSPKLRMYSGATFLVVIAADCVRDSKMTNRQVEALVFHELCHATQVINKAGEVKPAIVGHDLEMFWAEYQRYGAWESDLERAEEVFAKQERFEFVGEEPRAGGGKSVTLRMAEAMAGDRELVGAPG